MSTRHFETGSLSRAITGYLDSLEEEITLGTHERHLRRLAVLCRALLGQLVQRGGGTLETRAFERRIAQLSAVIERESEARAARPSSPPSLRVVH